MSPRMKHLPATIWCLAAVMTVVATVAAAAAPASPSFGEVSFAEVATSSPSPPAPCPPNLDLGGPHRTAIRIHDGDLARWREYDLAEGRCTVLIEPELQILALADPALGSLAAAEGSRQSIALPTLPLLDPSVEPPSTVQRDGRSTLDRRDLESMARAVFGRSAAVRRRGPNRSRVVTSTDAGSEPRSHSAPFLFGPDDRVRVADTTQFPFNTVVYVESEFPNGELLAYSGVLVAPYTVLTAASALYQVTRGGWAVAVEVAPGQTQESDGAPLIRPYGSRFDIDITVTQDWIDTEDAAFEYGAVFLEESFPGIDRHMTVVFDAVPADLVNIAGYDATQSGNSFAQWTRSGPLVSTDSIFFDHRMDNDAGTVGAPAWEYFEDTGARRLFGLDCCVDSTTNTNVGVRFTSDNEALIAEWMAFEPTDDPGPGPGDPEPLLIGGDDGDRFAVTVRWRDFDNRRGVGQPWELTFDTGYFYFFNPDNVELVVKVLDGCGTNDRFWFFAGGLTNVEVEVEVEDRDTGAKQSYFNPRGTPFQPIQDTEAFATCP